jgi:hypothetical protein
MAMATHRGNELNVGARRRRAGQTVGSGQWAVATPAPTSSFSAGAVGTRTCSLARSGVDEMNGLQFVTLRPRLVRGRKVLRCHIRCYIRVSYEMFGY